jgi:hypothetical protein
MKRKRRRGWNWTNLTPEQRAKGARKRWIRKPTKRQAERYRELLERSAKLAGLGPREAQELNSLQARIPKAVRQQILLAEVQQGIETIAANWRGRMQAGRNQFLDLFDLVKRGTVSEADEKQLDRLEADFKAQGLKSPLSMPWRRYRVALNAAARARPLDFEESGRREA